MNEIKGNEMKEREIKEREIKGSGTGWLGLVLVLASIILPIASFFIVEEESFLFVFAILVLVFLPWIIISGLKVIGPNEAGVYTLFGKYYGTIKKPGFYWLPPFTFSVNPSSQLVSFDNTGKDGNTTSMKLGTGKISLKATTLSNEKQKVNDSVGNPIEIGVIVIWKVIDPNKAVFEVDNYQNYISTQADGSIRQIARQYPYDLADDDDDEKTLRGSAQAVSEELKKEIQQRVEFAGIEIIDARIAHLAYAPEIAAAMLQRQQATAIIAARQKIVEGAVSMVEMALSKLEDEDIIHMDAERKAQMVSNLLVILCGNKDAQPIVNSGSIY